MFAKFAVSLFTVSAMVAGVFAAPIDSRTQSLNYWGNIQSMKDFDSFYGSDNYSGSLKEVVVKQDQVVCHAQEIKIVQQRLLVLQEMAKKIVTEVVCDVETQTFVFEQYYGSLGHFSGDLKRESGHQVGYDSSIVSHYGDVSDYSKDLGFSGYDYGKNYVVPSGSNWKEGSSSASVSSAYNTAHSLY